MSIIYILTIAFNLNIYIHISSSGFTSHFTTIFAKDSIAAGWSRIASSYKIPQLEFCKSQVMMFSEKKTFLLLLIFSVKALQ